MITLIVRQRTIAINKEQLVADAQKLLEVLKYGEFDLSILITNNPGIRKYNAVYRGKDKPTDVLSFPYYSEVVAGKRIRVSKDQEKNLGDLIFSAEYLVKEAEKYQVSFDERMRVLLVHGVCHLLGYDHIEDADYRRMRAKEAYLLKLLKA
jgi:rRNA maturation RNase YbeY